MGFDSDEAKRFLEMREEREKAEYEKERKGVLDRTISALKDEFANTNVEVYLVGSITRPFSFTSRSDVDIVLKNFHGDRFDIWTKLEKKIQRTVEIILFETCTFQEFVIKEGLKVI
jgi:predicted nucleotidyltransferase